MSFDFFFVFL